MDQERIIEHPQETADQINPDSLSHEAQKRLDEFVVWIEKMARDSDHRHWDNMRLTQEEQEHGAPANATWPLPWVMKEIVIKALEKRASDHPDETWKIDTFPHPYTDQPNRNTGLMVQLSINPKQHG